MTNGKGPLHRPQKTFFPDTAVTKAKKQRLLTEIVERLALRGYEILETVRIDESTRRGWEIVYDRPHTASNDD